MRIDRCRELEVPSSGCRGAAAAIYAIGLLLGPVARAEESKSLAATLFDEGKVALDAGRPVEACAKFAESQRLVAGVGTLANLARCHEQQGLLLEALGFWQQAQRLADQTKDPRRELATERATSLVQRIPTLAVVLAETAPKAVRIDAIDVRSSAAVTLRPEQLGVPRRVNPGTQRIVVEAPGRVRRTFEIDLVEGARERIAVDATLAHARVEGDRGPARPAAADVGPSTVTVGGLVVGAIGVAGLAVGGVFAGLASARNHESNEVDPATGEPPCDVESYCTATGRALRSEAIDAANASTALFIVGGAFAAAGLFMVILAPADEPTTDAKARRFHWKLAIGPGQLAIGGSF